MHFLVLILLLGAALLAWLPETTPRTEPTRACRQVTGRGGHRAPRLATSRRRRVGERGPGVAARRRRAGAEPETVIQND